MIEKIQFIPNDIKGSLEKMSFESVGRLFMGAIAYANDEDPERYLGDDSNAQVYFPTLEQHILRMEENRLRGVRNGSKGGAPVGNNNAKKTTKNNQKQPKTTQNKQKQAPNLTLPNLTNNKKTYGECQNVLLTDEEYKKVLEQGLTGLIDELSFYIAGSGKTYKSHYAVIRQWANRRAKETKVIKPTQFNTGYTKRPDSEFDYDSLVKN